MGFWDKVGHIMAKSAKADLGYAEAASHVVGGIGASIARGAKASFKAYDYKEGATILEKLIENPTGIKMKASASVPIALGLTGVGLANTGFQLNNTAKLGPVEAGRAANTVGSGEVSPGLQDEDEINKMGTPNLGRNIVQGRLNNYGAEGDLVMALHNLRKG